MITGADYLFYSTDADGDRAFLRDVLGFDAVDVGGGWLILQSPPSELAAHPARNGSRFTGHAPSAQLQVHARPAG